MLSIDDYNRIEESVRALVKKSLDDILWQCPDGYIQLLAGADYEPLHERTDMSPYVIDTPDRLFAEDTRCHFRLLVDSERALLLKLPPSGEASIMPLGILSNQVRDGFLEESSLGPSGLKREIRESLSNTRATTYVDLLELLASLALPRMSTVDVLCLAENLPLLFRSGG